MKPTILPAGRRHAMPRCMFDFFGNLETLPGIEEVRGYEFLRRRYSKSFQTHVQHYDESSKVLRIKAQYGIFIAFFNLRIDPQYRQEVEDYIAAYHPNRRNNGPQ